MTRGQLQFGEPIRLPGGHRTCEKRRNRGRKSSLHWEAERKKTNRGEQRQEFAIENSGLKN